MLFSPDQVVDRVYEDEASAFILKYGVSPRDVLDEPHLYEQEVNQLAAFLHAWDLWLFRP